MFLFNCFAKTNSFGPKIIKLSQWKISIKSQLLLEPLQG